LLEHWSLVFSLPPASTTPYTLSLHDALPISTPIVRCSASWASASARPSGSERGRTRYSLTAAKAGATNGRMAPAGPFDSPSAAADRKSTRLNSSHVKISYAVFCLKKKNRDIL